MGIRKISNTPATYNIAWIETVYHCLAFLLAVYNTYKHGRRGHLLWIYVTAYTLSQIAGDGMIIAAGQGGTPTYIAAILINMGLSLLVIGTAGALCNWFNLLEREVTDDPWDPDADSRAAQYLFGFLQLTAGFAAASVVTAGGLLASGHIIADTAMFLQAEAMLLMFCYAGTLFAAVRMYWAFRKNTETNPWLIWSLLVSLPFLGVRLIYELAMSFDGRVDLVMVHEKTWQRMVLDVLPRAVVVLILLVGGFGTRHKKKTYEKLNLAVHHERRE